MSARVSGWMMMATGCSANTTDEVTTEADDDEDDDAYGGDTEDDDEDDEMCSPMGDKGGVTSNSS